MKLRLTLSTRALAAALSVAGAVAVLVPAGPAAASGHGQRQTTAAAAAAVCEPGGYPGTPGMRVKSPDSPRVYLVDPNGYRRWIVSGGYFDLFRSWDGIRVIADLHCMWEGPDLRTFSNPQTPWVLDRGSFLAKDNQSPRVYLIDGADARWIVPGAFDKYRFDWNKIVTLDADEMWRTYFPSSNYWT